MVLSTMPIGDYDKRLVILTKERGKIAVFAKGARRQNSAFLACSQPFTFGKFQIYEGRNSYSLSLAKVDDYFEDVIMNLEAAYYGMYFCELSGYFANENEDSTKMLNLLYISLKALLKESIGMKLVRYIFELKLLTINGIGPQVFSCVNCGKEKERESLYSFSCKSGGSLCSDCKSYGADTIKISSSTLYTLQFIISTPLAKLYSFTVSEEVFIELKRCIDQYRSLYVDRQIKSLKVIENMF